MLKNKFGYSAVGVLMGAGIMGVVIVGMMDAINMAMRGQRTIDVRLATNEFESQIYNFLSSQNVCTYNFGNGTLPPINVSEFSGSNVKSIVKLRTQESGTEIFPYTTETTDNKNIYEQGRLKLVSMELREFQPSGIVGSDSLQALAKLRLNLQRLGNFLGTKDVVRDISLSLQLSALYPANPNPSIDFCLAVGGMGDQIWTQKPNKDIYYSGGKVGIGTNDPQYNLDINDTDKETRMRIVNNNSSVSRFPGFLGVNYIGAGVGGYPTVTVLNSRGTNVAPSGLQTGDILGAIAFWGGTGASSAQGAWIESWAADNFNATSSPTHLVFATTPTGTTTSDERMRISSNGNVGIGVTSPSAKLDVAGPVKLGTASLGNACNVSIEGSVAYDSIKKTLIVCDSLVWKVPALSGIKSRSYSSDMPPGGPSGPISITCPNGGVVTQCQMILAPIGNAECLPIVSTHTCSQVAGCTVPLAPQYWKLSATCLEPDI